MFFRVEDLPVDQIGDAYLLDFVGRPGFVQQLSPKVDRVIILDHHKTAVKMLEDGEFDSENVTKVIDGGSGATIAYEYFKEKISALANGNTSGFHKFEHRNQDDSGAYKSKTRVNRHEVIELKKRYRAFEETVTTMDRLEYTPQHLVRLLPIVMDGNCFKFNAPVVSAYTLAFSKAVADCCGWKLWYCIQFHYTPQHLVRLLPIVVDGNCFKFNAPTGSTRLPLRLRPPTDNQKSGFGSA
ncbi:hypothetical protein M8C21_027236 [Ambrosia artemisiifolia]|uniref:Uncharacterized protein n=1 Tax=Ambrosia artemisiifolia TaxID=4212 RepID=A0AAD5CGD7_AMBAR|nr:hypothetical protein M8C21_027236 [Ambrosia artemisiifolia]